MADRSEKSRSSSAGRPKSLTSKAPPTLNRSVMLAESRALVCICSRVRPESFRPAHFAGNRKTGSIASAISVICQDRMNMKAATITRLITLLTTPDSVEVKARWAPITSLLSRETSEPVLVREKKASGIRCTCPKTRTRRS